MKRPLAIVGTTASGKSTLAHALARAANAPDVELVSVDAMQVYRGMDIGTAKPTREEQREVKYHLIDVADPHEDYTVARFQADARAAIAGIEQRDKAPVLVGGTGLYLRAVVDDLAIPGQFPEVRNELDGELDTTKLHARLTTLDPTAAGRMEPTNRRRVLRALEVTIGAEVPFSSFGPGLQTYPPTPFVLVGLALEPELVARRIEDRYRAQLEHGFVDEVRALAERPEGLSRTARQALGYKEILAHLEGETTLDEALDLAIRRTRKFARRQRVWFRRDPRIHWMDVADVAAVLRHWSRCG